MTENPILFGAKCNLVGIHTQPDSTKNELPGVIILNASVLHRVGPNRLHVKLARQLAELNFNVLRFDFSGIGDSIASGENLTFKERSMLETQEAMDCLQSRMQIQRFALVGLCSGANAAFEVAACDSRVSGLIGINGSYLTAQQASEIDRKVGVSIRKRYYSKKLLNSASWRRLLSGKSNVAKITQTLFSSLLPKHQRRGRTTQTPSIARPLLAMVERGAKVHFIFSDGSSGLDVFDITTRSWLRRQRLLEKVSLTILEDADHVFTLIYTQLALVDTITNWLSDIYMQPAGEVAV